MKKIILLALLITSFGCFSQGIKQGLGSSNTLIFSKGTFRADSGLYIAKKDTLNHPYKDSAGLITYRPQNKRLYYSDANKFIGIANLSDLPAAWLLNGNAGTDPSINFIGTTDEQPLIFKANNEKAGRIDYFSNTANTFYGYKSGNVNSGVGNTGAGYNALLNNTTGSGNTAIGLSALGLNENGQNNTAIGQTAMPNNISGYQNTAVGSHSMTINSSGYGNQAFGYESLLKNVSGFYNCAIGSSALYENINGYANIGIGNQSLIQNTSGDQNIGIGYNSLLNNTTGSNNTAVGSYAGVSTGALSNTTAIGYQASVSASNTIQLGNSSVTKIFAGTGTTATFVAGGLQITGGTLGSGKVLTSDADGVATWQDGIDISGKLNISDTAAMLLPYATKLYSDAKVSDAINDGVTTIAPSQNAVFDALVLKQDNIGYTAENVANKENTVINNSTVKYPTVNLLNTGLGTKVNITDTAAMLANYLLKNSPIVGATKTKITYGANGLVNAGADATTADIAPSTNRNYVTDAQQVVIGNTSGVNTGDQDLSGLQPLDADLTAIAGLTPSNDDIIQRKGGAWANRTPAQFKTDLALTKSDVGLGNVDNTSDLNKPVSNATQAALDLKLNIADAYTDENAQDATGSMVDPTLVYNDGLPSLGRAAINGDITIAAGSNTADITAGVIVNADINAAAAISVNKLATLTASRVLVSDVSGFISPSSITTTTLGYLDATSSIQAQFGNKVTKGGDAGALTIGTNDATDLIFEVNNTARWTIDGATGYLRRGTGSAINGLQLYGTGVGSVLAFGDNFGTVPYVGLGEKGQIDSDQLEAYGQKGFYVTTGTYGSTSMITVQQDGDIILGGETQVPNAELTVIGDEDVSGNLNVQGNLTANNIISFSGVLDFPSTAAGTSSELTIAVAGAAVGDAIAPGIPTSNVGSMYEFRATANFVNIKFINSTGAAINPASATFKGKIFK